MTGRTLTHWLDLELRDLFYAYRKAKADCFFEHSVPSARAFARYESRLPEHLADLLIRLHRGELLDCFIEALGEPRIAAKRLRLQPSPNAAEDHGFFTRPDLAVKKLLDKGALIPEFRLFGDFEVDAHVLSALWINLVGHKFDAVLCPAAFAARLRRYRPGVVSPPGLFHIEAIGTFQPYFEPYKLWRARGFKTIRDELRNDRPVVALSLDLASYYHNIDPLFLADPAFWQNIGVSLNAWEAAFTVGVARALDAWSQRGLVVLQRFGIQCTHSGIPIGLSATRLIANVLLAKLDEDMERELAPLYYGRYVDDIFLVLKDPGSLTGAQDVLDFVARRTKTLRQFAGSRDFEVDIPHRRHSKLVLQPSKQKAFFLDGQGGLDFLESIEAQIRSVSSERRLIPLPDELDVTASAKVLTAAGPSSEEADSLAKADGLAVRRLSWSVQLRAVEILERALIPGDWKEERSRFYKFALNHVLRADKILDHVDYLPRLLSLAVGIGDWHHASVLVAGALQAVAELRTAVASAAIVINGFMVQQPDAEASAVAWEHLERYVKEASLETMLRALPGSLLYSTSDALPADVKVAFDLVDSTPIAAVIRQDSLSLREADLARVPYKWHLRTDAQRERLPLQTESVLCGLYAREADLRDFLREARDRHSHVCTPPEPGMFSIFPYVFPTRPYSAQEIASMVADCVVGPEPDATQKWARYARAVRGVWAKAADGGGGNPLPPLEDGLTPARIGKNHVSSVRLGISSLSTTMTSWNEGAAGRPDIGIDRFKRVRTIVNQAITTRPRPDYLLLPELSLPERWIGIVAAALQEAGICLIAGLDYSRSSATTLHSAAVLVLDDDRLGFPATVQVRQVKSLPAPHEEQELLQLHGMNWSSLPLTKTVYVHHGFCFGVLICSELQNIDYRSAFQGAVDSMMVLSWNTDLETFSALVDSASLDVHAYVALVNNREYGDSRVRSPAKKPYERDLCRLRGGLNEHLVVVKLDLASLRAFQSRAKRWPGKDDPFKPVPEGFEIWSYRKRTPR